jgi:hypothetical protein
MQKVNGDSVYPILNMLNAKYFIMPLQGGATTPVMNPHAMGAAWMVNDVKYVDNANEEIEAIGKVNLHNVAVADKKFESVLGKSVAQDSTSSVKITSYAPNELRYDVSSKNGGVVVFSEVYYPGWTATVDGQPVEVGRVNYVLRAINIKGGNHKVVLEFRPKTISTTEAIAYSSLVALVIAIAVSLFLTYRKKKEA